MMWNGSSGDSEPITAEFLLNMAQKYLQPGVIMLGHANHPAVLDRFDHILTLTRQRNPTPGEFGRDVRHSPRHRLNDNRRGLDNHYPAAGRPGCSTYACINESGAMLFCHVESMRHARQLRSVRCRRA